MHHLFTGPPLPAGFPRLPCSLAALGQGQFADASPLMARSACCCEGSRTSMTPFGGGGGGGLKTQETCCLKILLHDILGCTFVL